MGKSIEEIKIEIIQYFPKLKDDPKFEITSKPNYHYNCIAWACNFTERWIQPPMDNNLPLDCVQWWPPDIEPSTNPESLVALFQKIGYFHCDSSEFETNFRKIAIYYNKNTGEWTHASRQRSDGTWTSKLGAEQDIQHGTPESIENEIYGTVFCIMKMNRN